MYKTIDAPAIRKMLHVDAYYSVDALITYGTHPKQATEKLFTEQITDIFPHTEQEAAFTGFFQDIKSFRVGDKRLWFCVTYGGAMTSEVVHVAALLGAQKILHGGSCGALNQTLQIGDYLIPESSSADESCTRMYQRNGSSVHVAHTKLRQTVTSQLPAAANPGTMMSIQAMLAETKADIENWSQAGYRAVDLETATVLAVANHFQIPAAALLYVGDNLVTEELVHLATEEQRAVKLQAKQTTLTTLIQTACT